jgi:hypothetical protein
MVAANEVEELEQKLNNLTTLTWVYVAAHVIIVLVKVVMFFFYKQKIAKAEAGGNIYDEVKDGE